MRLPELLRSQAGALGEAGELGPDDVGVDGRLADPRTKAAVGSGDDVVAPDQPRVAADALGHQLGVLDEVGGRVDHPGDEYLAGWQLQVFEDLPFMGVPGIGRFEGDSVGTRGEDDVE